MLRGIDKRNLFFDNEDRNIFIENLIKAKGDGRFELFGYCLMDNHIHLLLKAIEEPGVIMKRITVGYVWWNNRKYERTGHLFQNRYLSEPVEKEDYLLTVLRYIHQNPYKAGLVTDIKDYRWSSYDQYRRFYGEENTFISGELIKAYFNTFISFRKFMTANSNDQCLDKHDAERCTDKKLKQQIIGKYGQKGLQSASDDDIRIMINEIYSNTSASIRQLNRVTGIGKSFIEKAIKKDK